MILHSLMIFYSQSGRCSCDFWSIMFLIQDLCFITNLTCPVQEWFGASRLTLLCKSVEKQLADAYFSKKAKNAVFQRTCEHFHRFFFHLNDLKMLINTIS